MVWPLVCHQYSDLALSLRLASYGHHATAIRQFQAVRVVVPWQGHHCVNASLGLTLICACNATL